MAGGTGTRLLPATRTVNKHLLPVHGAPMILYPIALLMRSGIRDILLISTPRHLADFRALLGDGARWGVRFAYAVQPRPEGLAQGLVIGRDFAGHDPVCLILGDNIVLGDAVGRLCRPPDAPGGALAWTCPVDDPSHYGVVARDDQGRPARIVEKAAHPPSRLAVIGLYCYDREALDLAARLRPSARGEYEITDLNNLFLERGAMRLEPLPDGVEWIDAGTPASLALASARVEARERERGERVACLEEIAARAGWIAPATGSAR